jgi:hypothetical protein
LRTFGSAGNDRLKHGGISYVLSLVDAIAHHLAGWAPGPPYVDLAIFETTDAERIARMVDAFSRDHLGSAIAGARFCTASVGWVLGAVLGDGREIVIKVHQSTTTIDHLRECVRLRAHLADHGSPAVLVGPCSLANGHAIVESYAELGSWRDPHEPAIRRSLARGLAGIVAALRPFAKTTTLSPMFLAPTTELWPKPHSRLFDFERIAAEAAWIDELAGAARNVPIAGDRVIAHADWRAEHLRFIDDRVVVGYDWDSLAVGPEPALVGCCAHAFTADWSHGAYRAQAPTVEEAGELVHAYEEARGRAFDRAERTTCAAAFAYACAYTARCGHALGVDERDVPGTFQHLVHRHGRELLELLA